MFLLVLSANLFSDAVRDAFDPRVRASLTTRLPLLRRFALGAKGA